jgi:hypothetical protein
VHPVRPDQLRHGQVGEGAGTAAPAALPIWRPAGSAPAWSRRPRTRAGSPARGAPPGAPGDAGDHEGRRAAPRRRPDLHERMVLRLVPVHAGRHVTNGLGQRGVHLEREAPASRARRPEQIGAERPLPSTHPPRPTGAAAVTRQVRRARRVPPVRSRPARRPPTRLSPAGPAATRRAAAARRSACRTRCGGSCRWRRGPARRPGRQRARPTPVRVGSS